MVFPYDVISLYTVILWYLHGGISTVILWYLHDVVFPYDVVSPQLFCGISMVVYPQLFCGISMMWYFHMMWYLHSYFVVSPWWYIHSYFVSLACHSLLHRSASERPDRLIRRKHRKYQRINNGKPILYESGGSRGPPLPPPSPCRQNHKKRCLNRFQCPLHPH